MHSSTGGWTFIDKKIETARMATHLGRSGWTFIDEQPQKTSSANSNLSTQARTAALRANPRPCATCSNCQTAKVKCSSSSTFQLACDRCQRKNLKCVRKLSTRYTRAPPSQPAPAESGQVTTQEVNQQVKQPVKQPGVVQKVWNGMRQVSTYVASGMYSMLENKLSGILAMGTPCHLKWFLAYSLLRGEVVRDQLAPTAPLMHVEARWLFDWSLAWKKVLEVGPDALCARARRSLRQDPATMEKNCMWIPGHLPQLHGPDAVFITTGVLGKVSKYTNSAWDRRFRTVDQMHEFNKTLTTRQPLATVGLFPLIGVIPAVSQQEVVNKYFFDGVLRSNMTPICGTTIAADYTSCTEFRSRCDDKFGNSFECNVSIFTCLQHEGAAFVRVIRCMPLGSNLESQADSPALGITIIPQPDIPELKHSPTRHYNQFTPELKRQKLNNSAASHKISGVQLPCRSVADSWDIFADEFADTDEVDDDTLHSIMSSTC